MLQKDSDKLDSLVYVSDELLTAADVVGRAYRVARLNWLALIRLFLVPGLVYNLAWKFMVFQNIHGSNSINLGLIAIFLIVMTLSRWELGVRTFALLYLISGRATRLEAALTEAKSKRPLILVLVLPVVLRDAALMVFFILLPQSLATMNPADAVFAYLLCFLIILPSTFLEYLNVTFMATLVSERLSLRSSIKRFFYLLFRAPIYAIWCLALFAGVYFSVEMANTVTEVVQLVANFFSGTTKEIVTAAISILKTVVLTTPLDSYLAAVCTLGASYLHAQLCMQLEGSDIARRLAELEGN